MAGLGYVRLSDSPRRNDTTSIKKNKKNGRKKGRRNSLFSENIREHILRNPSTLYSHNDDDRKDVENSKEITGENSSFYVNILEGGELKEQVNPVENQQQQELITPLVAENTDEAITNTAAENIKNTIVEKVGSTNISIFKKNDGSYELNMDKTKIKKLVFSGGGAKGMSYPGVITSLEKAGMMPEIESCFGSSAGSLQAALVASGGTAAEVKKYADALNIGALLKEEKKFYDLTNIPLFDEKPLSRLAKMKVFFDVIFRLFRKSSSISLKYEAYTNYVISTILLNRIHENNQENNPSIQDIIKKLNKQQTNSRDLTDTITFKDLDRLSKIIPEVKGLNVTATANIAGNYELLVFNKDSFGDTPISHAVMTSSSLPLVFPTVSQENFLDTGKSIKLMDGGCIMNTPHPSIIYQTFNKTFKKDDNLVLVFSEGTDVKKRGIFQRQTERFAKVPATMIKAEGRRLRGELPLNILKVPTSVYIGGKKVSSSTISFFQTQEEKEALQQEAELKTREYLQQRLIDKEQYIFTDLKTLLNSLEDKELQAIEDKQPGTCTDIIEMRKLGSETINNIKNLIFQYDENDAPKNEKVNTIINELTKLNKKVKNEPEFIEWFNFVVNDSEDLAVNRFLDLTRDITTPASNDYIVFNSIHNDRSKIEHRNRVFYVIREHIYPALFSSGLSQYNRQLIILGIDELLNSTTNDDIKKIMHKLQYSYKQRINKNKDIFSMPYLENYLKTK